MPCTGVRPGVGAGVVGKDVSVDTGLAVGHGVVVGVGVGMAVRTALTLASTVASMSGVPKTTGAGSLLQPASSMSEVRSRSMAMDFSFISSPHVAPNPPWDT